MTSRPDITIVSGQPLNALMIAINHYISTGEYVGEGIAIPEADGRTLVLLAVSLSDPTDAEDFRRFRARWDEIAPTLGLRIGFGGVEHGMEMWNFRIAPAQMPALTAALRERPGPLGWGSLYPILAEHGLTNG